jgi:Tannase and feruloyl esterase
MIVNRLMHQTIALSVIALTGGSAINAGGGSQASAETPLVTRRPDACEALKLTPLRNVEILSASQQPAKVEVPGSLLPDYFGGGKPKPVSGLPGFCRVIAVARPEPGSEITFEVWMPPTEGWNGRYFGTGNGGFAGPLEYMGMGQAISAGYATASTDTGHKGNGRQSGWAKGNPQKVRDYGWRGVHLMTDNAKKLVAAYYGKAAEKSYFSSCSNGGRQALMEASRYPEDYDGIVAGAPAVPFTKLVMSMMWTQQMQSMPGSALKPEQAKLLQQETIRQCDDRDSMTDGLINDPRLCKIDTSKLACGVSTSSQCLSPAQKTALDRIQAGPRNSRGQSVSPPYLLSGAEAGSPVPQLGWEGWIIAGGKTSPAHKVFPNGILQDLVAQPFADDKSFDWDRHPALIASTVGKDIDVQPNLSRFFARGGKLITWHGWSDAAIPPQNAIAFNTAMLRQSGSKARASSRLFMIPGMQHCFGGTGAINIGNSQAPTKGADPQDNVIAAVEQWVEKGRVPESLTGRMNLGAFGPPTGSGKQRLHCAWPKRAVLRQGADRDVAANYRCR